MALASEDIWEPELEGQFLFSRSLLTFAYRQRKDVVLSSIEDNRIITSRVSTDGVDLPRNWFLLDDGMRLMCSKDFILDLISLQPCCIPDPAAQEEYCRRTTRRQTHYISDSFVFGDYTISHFKYFGFVCYKGSEQVWKITCQGYLYSDMIFQNGCILFCTSGLGGHFYVVRLSTGEVLLDLNTHGTQQFITSDKSVFLLSRNKKSEIIIISSLDWTVVERIHVSGMITPSSRFSINNGKLYVVSFLYKNGSPKQVLLNVVE